MNFGILIKIQTLAVNLAQRLNTPTLRPTQPPIQWVPVALSLGVKRPGREADHSFPCTAEVKDAWSYNFTPQCAFIAWRSIKIQG
jgi:hypothetical protein